MKNFNAQQMINVKQINWDTYIRTMGRLIAHSNLFQANHSKKQWYKLISTVISISLSQSTADVGS